MTESLIFLTEPDSHRREAILAIIQRIDGTDTRVFDSLAATRKAMRAERPRLMIGPWSQGGETMIAARAAVAGNAEYQSVPLAVILTDAVSPARISLTKQAGNAELIPCDPLDEKGLFNRLTLLLGGTQALYATLDAAHPSTLDSALDHLPALKRRLAA